MSKLNDDGPLRITRVRVVGLFRLYDHDVPLRSADRVTVLHGPNGVGKTALLRMIAAAFGTNYSEFARVPFERLEITLSDGAVLSFEPQSSAKTRGTGLRLRFRSPSKAERTHDIAFEETRQVETLLRFAKTYSDITRLPDGRWSDGEGRTMDTSEAFVHYFGDGRTSGKAADPDPDWLRGLRGRVQVHLIETQRLLRMSPADHPLSRRRRRRLSCGGYR